METVSVPKSQTENVFKFSEPLLVINPSVDFKNVVKNEVFYKFSQPLDVLSGKAIAGSAVCLDTSPINISTLTGFGNQFKRSRKEWECNVCMIYNTPELENCVACKAPRKAITLSFDSSFGQKFKKSADKWECDTCMIQNTQDETKCIACETPRRESYKSEADEGFKTLASQQKASKWECSTCMTQNDNNCFKCVCCEQSKPGHIKKSEETVQSPAVSRFSFGFGNGTNGPTESDLRKVSTTETAQKPATEFKFGFANTNKTSSDAGFKALASQQKASKWECSTCMTQNDNNCFKCVCCEQSKPGHIKKSEETVQSPAVSRFSFGFGNGTNGPTENDLRKVSTTETAQKPATELKFGFANTNTTLSDAGFKALASQQKASKWECIACMTQNENNSNNCVCCEQQKPGQKTKEKLTAPAAAGNNTKTTTSEPSSFLFGFKTCETMSWECGTCLVRNKPESTKCVCCESVRQNLSKEKSPTCTIPKETETKTTKFKFGFENSNTTPVVTDFKALASQQKASKWECSTCMTQNDSNKVKCVCCEEPKPGALISESNNGNSKLPQTASTTNFRFGFFPETKASTESQLTNQLDCKTSQVKKSDTETNDEKQLKFCVTSNSPADDKFKALAAQQKASKWECGACMAQNDTTLVKCACCEQVKSGEKTEVKTSLQNEVTAPKFRFGFGGDAPTEEELRKKL